MNPVIKKRALVAVTVLVFGLLIFLVLFDYNAPTTHVFNPNGFYVGNDTGEVDPRVIYTQIHQGLAPGSGSCWSNMRKADEPRNDSEQNVRLQMAGNYVWIAPTNVSGYSDIETFESDEGGTLKPYNDGDIIISPSNLKFVNSNKRQNSADTVYIEAVVGGYLIRWENVACWWCHEGRENPTKHTDTYGKGGSFATCIAGYVVGIATADTTVKLFEINDDGSTGSQVKFSELFGDF